LAKTKERRPASRDIMLSLQVAPYLEGIARVLPEEGVSSSF